MVFDKIGYQKKVETEISVQPFFLSICGLFQVFYRVHLLKYLH